MSALPGDPPGSVLEGLRGELRRSALRRIAASPRERAGLVAEEPTRIFALLAAEPLPEDVLERVSAEVATAIRDRTAAAEWSPRRGIWAMAAALAAGVVLALTLGIELRRPLGTPATRAAGGSVATAGIAARPRGGLEVVPVQGTARVIDLSVGSVQVVMVFDRELER
jgi:hypothetical protein